VRRPIALACVLLALPLAAGCGSDDDDGSGGAEAPKDTAAKQEQQPAAGEGGAVGEFISCFDAPGYEAKRQRTTLGVSATLAEAKGYDVTSVLLESDEGAFKSSFVQFFKSEAELKEATRKLDLDFGSADVPEPDVRGDAVVEYVTKDAKKALEAPVNRCL
jgi:hypothetical protein